MDNLVVLHTRHALDLLGVLRLLRHLGNQLLQMLYLMLQLGSLSLTRLELLISLVQLGLKVVDVSLGHGQLVLGVLQSGVGAVEIVSPEVTSTINPHRLIIQFLDARLKVGVLLKELSVALLNVLNGMVISLHLASTLL
jgi:hypothetical protein